MQGYKSTKGFKQINDHALNKKDYTVGCQNKDIFNEF